MQKKIVLSLIHSVPGRTRFRLLGKGKLPKLEDLLQVSGVEEVIFRDMTNSLIIYHQQNLTTDNLVSKLKKKFPLKIKMIKKKPSVPSVDSLAALFAGLGKKANRKVKAGTGDMVSLYSLIPTLFMTWALIELIRNPKTPPWYNLINVSKALHGYLELIKQ